MKRIMLTLRDFLIMTLLCLLPLILGLALDLVIKGNFDFVLRYLDMALMGIGAAAALYLFRKKGSVKIPVNKKAPGKMYLWYILFGFMGALLPLTIMIHGCSPDEEITCDLTKQLAAIFIAPITEELACRCLMTHIIKRGSQGKGICIFTAVFTTFIWNIPHCYGMTIFSARVLLLGLTASFIYQKTGDIRLCIFEHAANNLAVTIVLLIGRPFGSTAAVVAASVISAIVMTGLICETAKLFRKDSSIKTAAAAAAQ